MAKRLPLLIAVAAIVLLAVLSTVAWLFIAEVYRPSLARHQCVGVAYELSKRLGGKEPETRDQVSRVMQEISEEGNVFVRNKEGDLIDAWGTPFDVRLVHDGNGCLIVVRSAGRDRVMGSGDDLVYDALRLESRQGRGSD